MDQSRLHHRVALITGAGNGIGKAIALKMASEGASVVVNDLGTSVEGKGCSPIPADATVAEIREMGGTAVASYDSISDADGCKRAYAALACNSLVSVFPASKPDGHDDNRA